MRPHERVRRRAEFQQIYARGVRLNGRYSTLFFLATDSQVGRLGIAATRKFGGAVERNRAKRLIREVFRRNKVPPGFDVVVVPKRGLLVAGQSAFEAEYCALLQRVCRRGSSKA